MLKFIITTTLIKPFQKSPKEAVVLMKMAEQLKAKALTHNIDSVLLCCWKHQSLLKGGLSRSKPHYTIKLFAKGIQRGWAHVEADVEGKHGLDMGLWKGREAHKRLDAYEFKVVKEDV
ncbi:hypothetical protein ONZ45_g19253 [Pleurotus djamor]|nr:hypothetical protein ONZ45_g19253 [Pleurotus djamor]